jgi:hypothetical protein
MRQGIGVAMCILCAIACARQPDADAIRATITTIGAAAEAHRSTDMMAHVSEDFVGNDGEVDRAQLADLLRAQLLAGRNFAVRLGRVDVEMIGDRAVARFDVALTDVSGRWFADREATLKFETGWRREQGTWHCYNAHWERKP